VQTCCAASSAALLVLWPAWLPLGLPRASLCVASLALLFSAWSAWEHTDWLEVFADLPQCKPAALCCVALRCKEHRSCCEGSQAQRLRPWTHQNPLFCPAELDRFYTSSYIVFPCP
jgi:hypothetical protein